SQRARSSGWTTSSRYSTRSACRLPLRRLSVLLGPQHRERSVPQSVSRLRSRRFAEKTLVRELGRDDRIDLQCVPARGSVKLHNGGLRWPGKVAARAGGATFTAACGTPAACASCITALARLGRWRLASSPSAAQRKRLKRNASLQSFRESGQLLECSTDS